MIVIYLFGLVSNASVIADPVQMVGDALESSRSTRLATGGGSKVGDSHEPWESPTGCRVPAARLVIPLASSA